MSTMKHSDILMVGGPRDGRRLSTAFTQQLTELTLDGEHYRLITRTTEGGEAQHVWLHSTLDMDGLFARLLDGYETTELPAEGLRLQCVSATDVPLKRPEGWIGVDLDGTLADYSEGWKGPATIGKPIKDMLRRVLDWRAQGIEVRIVTARVATNNPDRDAALVAIHTWCERWVGERLPVTHEKDMGMIELWDDRAIQVIQDTGVPMVAVLMRLMSENAHHREREQRRRAKANGKIFKPTGADQLHVDRTRNRGRQR